MAENKNRSDSPKPESASKAGKHAYEERERDRASHSDKSQQDSARGNRNPGNVRGERERASEAGCKGGQR